MTRLPIRVSEMVPSGEVWIIHSVKWEVQHTATGLSFTELVKVLGKIVNLGFSRIPPGGTTMSDKPMLTPEEEAEFDRRYPPPIESTKELHESKERKPEMTQRTENYIRNSDQLLVKAAPSMGWRGWMKVYLPNGDAYRVIGEEFDRDFTRVALPRGAEPETPLSQAIDALEHFAYRAGEDHRLDADPDQIAARIRLESLMQEERKAGRAEGYATAAKDAIVAGYVDVPVVPPRGEAETPTDTKLDENTEMMVNAVLAETDAPYGGYFLTNKVLAALRTRIRQLIREAGAMKAIRGKLPEERWDY